jgi:hypothetical protein
MSAINSFFSNANAASYVDTLFSASRPSGASSFSSERFAAHGATGSSETAGQRALARIVEILTLGSDETAGAADIDEQLGYITGGNGTEGADELTVTGRGIFRIDTASGNDTLTLKSAEISDISLGDGADSLKSAGSFIGAVDGGEGDDDIQIKAMLALDILGGAGNDTLKVAADTIIGLDGGDGDDTLNLEGTRIFATGGAGNDTVSIRMTGSDAEASYGFGRGGGQDKVASNGALTLQLGGLGENDMTLSVSGGTLTAKVNGSDDMVTITLDSDALTYRFAVEDGQTVLKLS